MSLYLGKTSSGGLLHVTSDSKSKAELTGSPIPTTVFHSSLPYLELISVTNVTINTTTASNGYSVRGYGTWMTGLITATIPDSLFQYFNDGYLILVECTSRNSNNVPAIIVRAAMSAYSSSYYNNYNTYHRSMRTFTNTINVPIGGDYYNTSYANVMALPVRYNADSSFRYLVLSFGESSGVMTDNCFLQTDGAAQFIDVVNPVGKVYVIKLHSTNLSIGNSNGLSVLLNKNQFIVSGNGNSIDLSNYSFVSSSGTSGDVNFLTQFSKSYVGGFNFFNKEKLPATGWNINFNSSNFYIDKLTSQGTKRFISPTTNYLKLVSSSSYDINLSFYNSYSKVSLLQYNGNYKFFIVFMSLYTNVNGYTTEIPSHYQVGFVSNQAEYAVGTSFVSMTNTSAATTTKAARISYVNSGSQINVYYDSYISAGAQYTGFTTYTVTTGKVSLLVFN